MKNASPYLVISLGFSLLISGFGLDIFFPPSTTSRRNRSAKPNTVSPRRKNWGCAKISPRARRKVRVSGRGVCRIVKSLRGAVGKFIGNRKIPPAHVTYVKKRAKTELRPRRKIARSGTARFIFYFYDFLPVAENKVPIKTSSRNSERFITCG